MLKHLPKRTKTLLLIACGLIVAGGILIAALYSNGSIRPSADETVIPSAGILKGNVTCAYDDLCKLGGYTVYATNTANSRQQYKVTSAADGSFKFINLPLNIDYKITASAGSTGGQCRGEGSNPYTRYIGSCAVASVTPDTARFAFPGDEASTTVKVAATSSYLTVNVKVQTFCQMPRGATGPGPCSDTSCTECTTPGPGRYCYCQTDTANVTVTATNYNKDNRWGYYVPADFRDVPPKDTVMIKVTKEGYQQNGLSFRILGCEWAKKTVKLKKN